MRIEIIGIEAQTASRPRHKAWLRACCAGESTCYETPDADEDYKTKGHLQSHASGYLQGSDRLCEARLFHWRSSKH
jgi:hypothetical protein